MKIILLDDAFVKGRPTFALLEDPVEYLAQRVFEGLMTLKDAQKVRVFEVQPGTLDTAELQRRVKALREPPPPPDPDADPGSDPA